MHTQIDYPKNIYDPFRREIAVRYIRHELRKLFSNIRDEQVWEMMDTAVAKWFKDEPSLMPVRDFWNGLHGISMGFRLKNIVSYLTSANIDWQERDISVKELWFGATLRDLEPIGQAPAASDVQAWFYDPTHAEILAAARLAEEQRGAQTMPRNQFPIFVVQKEGKFRVVDGNRRLLRAIFLEQTTIKAVIGQPLAQPPIFEAWVPTQTLIDLVASHRYWASLGRNLTQSIATVIAELIRDSTSGRLEFVHRSVSKSAEPDLLLCEAVRKQLKELGIDVPLEEDK